MIKRVLKRIIIYILILIFFLLFHPLVTAKTEPDLVINHHHLSKGLAGRLVFVELEIEYLLS